MFPNKIDHGCSKINNGEREIGESINDFSNDHVNRYDFAKYFIRSCQSVLDVACGVGYGTYILSSVCKKINGIDYNDEAIKFATSKWKNKNARFLQGDILGLDNLLDGERFDIIVSFETIEHIDDDKAALQRLVGALKNDGVMFISSPNSLIHDAKDNAWHIRHYTPTEFKGLLCSYFKNIYEFTQIECGVRKGRGGDNNILVCTNRPLFFLKIYKYLIHNLLYRVKKKIFGGC